MSKRFFNCEETLINPGKYIIRPNFNELPLKCTIGSYNILPARLMNLSYAQYLRMCRDVYGAEVTGKKTMYPMAFFDSKEQAKSLLEELDKRAAVALKKI